MSAGGGVTTCSRRLTFSAGHRVYDHEGQCRYPHGHNYVVIITAAADELDPLGRVVDFSVLKNVIGGWLRDNWDHAFLFWAEDQEMSAIYHEHPGWKHAALPMNPTAENLAQYLLEFAPVLLCDVQIEVTSVRVEETENCSATAERQA